MKGRLDKISKLKEGRGKLVSTVMGEGEVAKGEEEEKAEDKQEEKADEEKGKQEEAKGETRDMAQMDHRLGELEKIIGSSSTTLDEVRSVLSSSLTTC